MRLPFRCVTVPFVLFALLVLAAPVRAEEPDVDPAKIFADPEFKKYFLATYGVHPDVEPRLGPEDRAVLEKAYPLMGTDQAAATKLFADAAAKPEASALFDFLLGNMALQADKVADALARYQTAVTKFPNFRRAWKTLGLAQVREGQIDGAIRSFTKMIELGGGDAISYGLLGYAYSAKSDFLAAETAYRNALLLDPQNGEWRLGLARSVVKQEKFEEAAALLRVLIERNPDRAEFWMLQANAYLGMKQPLRAAENLEVVARMEKASVDGMNLLGNIYVNENRPDLAASAYARAVELDPQQSPGRSLQAIEALAARGANAEARALAAKVRTAFGERLDEGERRKLLKTEARIAAAAGDGEQAAKVLEDVVALDPLDGDALVLLGQHYARAGNPEKATVYLERAANLDAFEAPAKMRLGQLLVNQGKYQQALPLLKRAQELKPTEEIARYIEQVERLARKS